MIYICCPSNHATGGTELLHQLCHSISQNGNDCMLWYFDAKSNIHPTPERFDTYKCNYLIEKPLVEESDVLIVPETLTDLLYDFEKGKKCIWWLSVDFYKRTFKTKRYFVRRYLKGAEFFRFKEDKNVITHLYQSEYARKYLEDKRVSNIVPLSDYISDIFFEFEKEAKKIKRRQVVLYNPKKGIKTTEKIIKKVYELDKEIKFIALENMTPIQMADLMCEASVYIDFGHHPGKDRMPREAAALGCVVITGKEGAAGNSVDVPIPDKYKIDIHQRQLNEATELIIKSSRYYGNYCQDFAEYREIVRGEKEKFQLQVKQILRLISSENI
jgi:hypothetical protein